jgi:hypothetical protein
MKEKTINPISFVFHCVGNVPTTFDGDESNLLSLSHVKFHTMSSFFLMWHLINYKPKSHCLNIIRSHLTKDMWYPPSRGLDLTLLFNLQSRAGAGTVRKSCDC